MSFEDVLRVIALQYGYIGTFLVSFIGASSVIIPIPYTAVILTLGLYTDLNLVLLALASGLGSALGEVTGYLAGRSATVVISKDRKRRLEALAKLLTMHSSLTPIVIFVFALTPLPDDLLFIPLGLLRYPLFIILLPSFLGKALMAYLIAYGGRTYNHLMLYILNQEMIGSTLLLTSVASALLVLVAVGVMLRVDWEAVLVTLARKSAYIHNPLSVKRKGRAE